MACRVIRKAGEWAEVKPRWQWGHRGCSVHLKGLQPWEAIIRPAITRSSMESESMQYLLTQLPLESHMGHLVGRAAVPRLV